MYKKRLLLMLVMAFPLMMSGKAMVFDAQKGLGEDFKDPQGVFETHGVVKNFPFESTARFTVEVNGRFVGLYNDWSRWEGLVHFGGFEFENGEEITLDIHYWKKIDSFELLPGKRLRLLEVKQTSENGIRVRLDEADQNITLVVNGEPQKDVLHLFCNSIDHNAPRVVDGEGFVRDEGEKLIYFGPGYHSLKAETGADVLQIPDGWRVYVAAGAVVHGSMACKDAKWFKIDGRGMVYNDNRTTLLKLTNVEGGGAHGVFFHCHCLWTWQVILDHCRGVEFKGVKILDTRYASTDGLDLVNCQYCAFLNCFIRANDDAITLKGLEQNKPTAECAPFTNITFCGMQLWNDCNCGFVIGEESHAAYYRNIRFMNSSILYSYDDPDHHEELPERAALTICCLHATHFSNISYENVDIYHCERFIAAGFQPSFWFGSIPGDQTGPGGIKGITFRNVNCYGNSGSKIANKIHLYGWKKGDGTPDKWVEDVVFDNVWVEGKRLDSAASPYFSETEWETVRNVSFKP